MSGSGLSFQDLIVRVAEFRGWASHATTSDDSTNVAKIPTDANMLDKCKRAVNDALSLIAMSNPHEGGWACLREVIDLTVRTDGSGPDHLDSDPTKLMLPQHVPNHWHADVSFLPAGSQTTYMLSMSEEARVRAFLASDSAAGSPVVYSKLPVRVGSDDTTAHRWALHIAPRPSENGTLTCTVRTVVMPLAAMSDRHPFGAALDAMVVSAACWMSIRHDYTDPDKRQGASDTFDRDLAAAIRIDDESKATVISRHLHMVAGNSQARRRTEVYINDQLVN